jgi:hypothetical protein
MTGALEEEGREMLVVGDHQGNCRPGAEMVWWGLKCCEMEDWEMSVNSLVLAVVCLDQIRAVARKKGGEVLEDYIFVRRQVPSRQNDWVNT